MELYLEIVSADVTKLRCSRAGLEWTPIQYGLCPHKKRGRETKGRASWKDRGRDWGDVSTSQGTPRLPATMRSKEKSLEQSLPQGLRWSQSCQHLDFRLPSSATLREAIVLC